MTCFKESKKGPFPCPACLINHDFSPMKLMIKFYIQYDKIKAGEKESSCISSKKLKLYVRNKIPENEKNHLICCEKCTDKFLNLTASYSIWNSLKEEIDKTSQWLKEITLTSTLGLTPARGLREEKKVFLRGDEIYLKVSSNKDGYLTIIHWNGEEINLVLPNIYEKNTFIKAKEEKKLKARIDPPPGLQEVRIFLTEKNLFKRETIDFEDKSSVQRKIKKFVEKLKEVKKDWWVRSYEVK